MTSARQRIVRSRDNTAYRRLARLVASARERRDAALMVLEGERLVRACLDTLGGVEQLVLAESAAERPAARALMARVPTVAALRVADRLLESISGLDAPDGVLALAARPAAVPPSACDFALLLEDLQDPGNVGTIIRTAAAAGVQLVQLSRGCADPWSPKALRAGMGGQFATVVQERADLEAAAAAFGGQVIATLPQARETLYDVDLRGPIAFIVGNEGSGVSPRLLAHATRRVRLPMAGAVESVNAAAAAAVCVFEALRQRRGS